jgi:hypothetical protein
MVTPALRAVAVRPAYPLIEARFIYEAVGEQERMIADDVEAFVVADFIPPVNVRFVAVAVPPSAGRELESGEEWVYLRHESELPGEVDSPARRGIRPPSTPEHKSINGGPVMARFRSDGVELDLDKPEYIFVYLTLSYVLDGVALADHDFRNILGMTREDAEAFLDGLEEAERIARVQGNHWNPNVTHTEYGYSAKRRNEGGSGLDEHPFLTEDIVAVVMRLLISGEIERPVACRFLAPWVEGDLPSSPRAESGAQTVHGLDIVRNDAGHEVHPMIASNDYPFVVDTAEMIRRCVQWLGSTQ